MGNLFSGSEVVKIGIQIEKNGGDFYNALAKRSKNEKARDVFRYLAGEEEKHIAVFKKILESLEKYEPSESYPGEYAAYMNTLAGDYVFTKKNKGAEMAKKMESDKEAIEAGVGFEKDSIIFYEGIKRSVPEDEHKVLEALIIQEQCHLRQLLDLKKDF